MIKTLHDVALGFFVSAGYGITEGGNVISNGIVMVFTVIILYKTNKESTINKPN